MADGDPPTSAPPSPFHADGLKPSLSTLLPSNPLFSEIVKGQITQSFPSGNQPRVDNPSTYLLKPISIYQNKPAVFFSSSDKKTLLDNLKHVLVGKFTHGRPPFSTIKEFFATLRLKGEYNLSLFDAKHIFIECQSKADFTRLWMRLIWHIKGYAMRMFKWDSDFTPAKESPIAPVWVRIEGLPLYLFEEHSLLSIANSIGYPLKVDPRNINRFNLSSARICVELDVSKPLLDDIWVCFVDELSQDVLDAFVVKVFFDFVPSYCKLCAHIGHHEGGCKRRSVKNNAVAKMFDVRPQTEKSGVCKVLDVLSQTEKPGADKVFDVCPQIEEPGVGKVFDVLSQPSHVTTGHYGSRYGGKDMVSVTRENTTQVDQVNNQNSVQDCPKVLHDSTTLGVERGTDPLIVKNLQPTVIEDKVFDKRSNPVPHVSEVFVELLEPNHSADQNGVGQSGPEHCATTKDADGLSVEQADQSTNTKNAEGKLNAMQTEETAIGVQALSLPAPVEDTPDREDQQNPAFPDTEKATSQVQADITIRETVAAVVEVVKQQSTPEVDKMAAKPRMKSVINTEGYVSKYTSQNIKADTTLQKLHGEVPKDCSPKQKEQDPFQEKNNPQKQQPKPFHTDLPIDFDPILCNQETEEKKLWSQLVGGVKLLVRRSISPIGRSSEKLIKLRKRVEFIEYDAGKTFAMDLDEYLEGNKEQFQLKAKDPSTPSRNHRPRRRRGQGRVEDGNGHGPDRGRNRDRR